MTMLTRALRRPRGGRGGHLHRLLGAGRRPRPARRRPPAVLRRQRGVDRHRPALLGAGRGRRPHRRCASARPPTRWPPSPDEPQFDLAFIDADKTGYRRYFDELVPRLRPGGVILVDNVLWSGASSTPTDTSDDTVALRAFNDHVVADDRVDCVMLAVGDGLTIIAEALSTPRLDAGSRSGSNRANRSCRGRRARRGSASPRLAASRARTGLGRLAPSRARSARVTAPSRLARRSPPGPSTSGTWA